jgi:formyltetrahydrofolate synthetase
MEDITCHFTATTTPSLRQTTCLRHVDNHIRTATSLALTERRIRAALHENNDRHLRNIGADCAARDVSPGEDGFDITSATERMANTSWPMRYNELKQAWTSKL